ncbi:hypothetical protein [uncultured Bacteroides sp.]|uniref:hypothetical protein n=1 Tax=uncultured Bacteroides sp. TaxID=162156 RepID=UPI002AA8EEEE|nr:hypothetical protein [uncultured Bacteroides sp.]
MNIEELLNNYFEGETTCEEERELRRYFSRDDVPEHLQAYRPIFAYFEEEAKRNKKTPTAGRSRKNVFRRHIIYALSGIAAGILLAIGIAGLYKQASAAPDNYVIIDGKKYTDAGLIHEQAQAAFQNVSVSKDEVFATLFNE